MLNFNYSEKVLETVSPPESLYGLQEKRFSYYNMKNVFLENHIEILVEKLFLDNEIWPVNRIYSINWPNFIV